MIGTNEKSWNSLHNLVVPALIAWIEASWVSAIIDALVKSAPHTPVNIPFWALFLPAIMAVGLSTWGAHLPCPAWTRILVVTPLGLILAGLTAGVLGATFLHSPFVVTGFHPWDVANHIEASRARTAWFIGPLVVLRGTWLGWKEPSRRHATNAVALGTLGFVALFISGAAQHASVSFHPSLAMDAFLLVLSFPMAIAVIALIHERELERLSLREERSRTQMAWLGAVVIPMIAVAIVGTLLAVAVGPLAPYFGRAVRAIAHFIAACFSDFARWLSHYFHAAKLQPTKTGGGLPGIAIHPTKAATVSVPLWISLLAAAVCLIVLAILVHFILRALRSTRDLVHKESKQVEEERESVFTWQHLLRQILDVLKRRRRRNRGDESVLAVHGAVLSDDLPDSRSIREQYRRVLRAASLAGHGRTSSETPLEFEVRLLSIADMHGAGPLQTMTSVYEWVRYGNNHGSDEDINQARNDADSIVGVFREIQEGDVVG